MSLITPTSRQMRFFNIAKRKMTQSTYKKFNGNSPIIGAVIVKGNYIVSEGCNKNKTHTIQHYNNIGSGYYAPIPNIHAEIDALIRSKFADLSGCELFVYRETVNGELANSKPCKSCMPKIIDSGIKHLYYTSVDGFQYERLQ